MRMTRLRRSLALVASAALLASLAAATVAAPASAAKPKCFGQEATIVGTNKGERIVGTNKRDVIVAKGGNDRIFGRGGNDLICGGAGADRLVGGPGIDKLLGQTGPDRLFGGAGPDRLFAGVGNDLVAGGPGNDVIDGGPGTDTCYQNLGTGPLARCELPAAPPAAAPAPQPPAAPTPIPLTDILAVAYTDLNGNDIYDTGDVLIAKLVDTDGNGLDAGDRIEMNRYPLVFTPSGPNDFGAWGDVEHEVLSVVADEPSRKWVNSDAGGHAWIHSGFGFEDLYDEAGGGYSQIFDLPLGDTLYFGAGSPSVPSTPLPNTTADGSGDDDFVDVVIP